MDALKYLDFSSEVKAARNDGKPVVALESTIISHGLPYPMNRELALELEETVRMEGATPATIGICGGRIKVGMNPQEIERFSNGSGIAKVSRRDFATIVALNRDGATTVSGTMIAARLAGIRLFATGGIGGVHRGAEDSMDISADLLELAQTQVAVVCAGAKSILDLPKTLEVLETHGVPVLGFQTNAFPAFHTTDSGLGVDMNVGSVEDIANILSTRESLGLKGGEIIANPIPDAYAMDKTEVDGWIDIALTQAQTEGITGKATTPYLLAKIAELSEGRTITANKALVINNARLAAEIAVSYASTAN